MLLESIRPSSGVWVSLQVLLCIICNTEAGAEREKKIMQVSLATSHAVAYEMTSTDHKNSFECIYSMPYGFKRVLLLTVEVIQFIEENVLLFLLFYLQWYMYWFSWYNYDYSYLKKSSVQRCFILIIDNGRNIKQRFNKGMYSIHIWFTGWEKNDIWNLPQAP